MKCVLWNKKFKFIDRVQQKKEGRKNRFDFSARKKVLNMLGQNNVHRSQWRIQSTILEGGGESCWN